MRTCWPALEPVLRVGALAVHAHLAFADDALDVAERQPGKPRLEEAVEPHAGFVGRTVTVCTPVATSAGGGARRRCGRGAFHLSSAP